MYKLGTDAALLPLVTSADVVCGFHANDPLVMSWRPGAHGSTFGGNPVCCAAARATLDVIEQDGLLDNAARVGQ